MLRMKFRLDLDCENAAFAPEEDDPTPDDFSYARRVETSRILLRLAEELVNGYDPLNSTASLMDLNGHRVGSAVFREVEA